MKFSDPLKPILMIWLSIFLAPVCSSSAAAEHGTVSCSTVFRSLVEQNKENLIEAIGGAREAGTRMDRQMANYHVAQYARTLMISRGFRCSDVTYDDKHEVIYFEITSSPSILQSSKVISSLTRQGKHVIMGINGDNGTWIRQLNSVFISAQHALLGDDIISNTLLHEVRHSVYTDRIKRGTPSFYQALIRNPTIDEAEAPKNFARLNNTVTRVKDYPTYFSFEELSTFMKDIALLRAKAGVPNVNNVIDGKPIDEIIKSKIQSAAEMANEIIDVTAIAMKILNSTNGETASLVIQPDPEFDNVLKATFSYKSSPTSQDAKLDVWLPELKFQNASELTLNQVRDALRARLGLMEKNARLRLQSLEVLKTDVASSHFTEALGYQKLATRLDRWPMVSRSMTAHELDQINSKIMDQFKSSALIFDPKAEGEELQFDGQLVKDLELEYFFEQTSHWFPKRISISSERSFGTSRLTDNLLCHDPNKLRDRQTAVRLFVEKPELVEKFDAILEKARRLGQTLPDDRTMEQGGGIGDHFLYGSYEQMIGGHFLKTLVINHRQSFADVKGLAYSLRSKTILHDNQKNLGAESAELLNSIRDFAKDLRSSHSRYLAGLGEIIQSIADEPQLKASYADFKQNEPLYLFNRFLKLVAVFSDVDTIISLGNMARLHPGRYHFAKILPYDAPTTLQVINGENPMLLDRFFALGQSVVANSADMQTHGGTQVAVLRGPNKRGKSTYLKQLSWNNLLTNLGAPGAFAEGTALTPNYVFSAMLHDGRVEDSESGFSSNSKAILDQVKRSRRVRHSLNLVDEPYTGTSPSIADATSLELIRHLAVEPSLWIVVTHSEVLQGAVSNVPNITSIHNTYDYQINQGSIPFDYSGDTLTLMKNQGYDDVFPRFTDDVRELLSSRK